MKEGFQGRLQWLIGLSVVMVFLTCIVMFINRIGPLQRAVESIGGNYEEYNQDFNDGTPLWRAMPSASLNLLLGKDRRTVRIYLFQKPLTDEWLAEYCGLLGDMPLNSLNLAGTQITDEGFPKLGQARSTADLDVSQTSISDRAIPTILTLKNLHAVNLSETDVSPAGIIALTQHPRIWRVAFDGELLTDEVVAQLNQVPQIRELTLHDENDEQLGRVSQLVHVKYLTVQSVSEDSFPALAKLGNLTQLTLLDNELSMNTLAELQKLNPKLLINHWGISYERAVELGVYENMARQQRARALSVMFFVVMFSAIVLAILFFWRRSTRRRLLPEVPASGDVPTQSR